MWGGGPCQFWNYLGIFAGNICFSINLLHLEEARKMSPLDCRVILRKSQAVLHCGISEEARHGKEKVKLMRRSSVLFPPVAVAVLG